MDNLLFTVSWSLPLIIKVLKSFISSSNPVTLFSTSSMFPPSMLWLCLLFIHEIDVAGNTADDNFWVKLRLLSRISVQQATIGSKKILRMNKPMMPRIVIRDTSCKYDKRPVLLAYILLALLPALELTILQRDCLYQNVLLPHKQILLAPCDHSTHIPPWFCRLLAPLLALELLIMKRDCLYQNLLLPHKQILLAPCDHSAHVPHWFCRLLAPLLALEFLIMKRDCLYQNLLLPHKQILLAPCDHSSYIPPDFAACLLLYLL